MCMEQVGEVAATGNGTAVLVTGSARLSVSLVILGLEGVPVAPGDWLVTHSGIAVRKITADEAAGMLAERRGAAGPRS